MYFYDNLSPEEKHRLERQVLFSYVKTLKSWISLKNSPDPVDDLMQSTAQTLRFCLDTLLNVPNRKEIVSALDIASSAVFSIAWELAKRMFFLGMNGAEDPPKDSTSVSELYDRVMLCSHLTGEDCIDLAKSPLFSEAENELFRSAIHDAIKDVADLDKYERALFSSPDDCLMLYNSPGDSVDIFLSPPRDDKFTVKHISRHNMDG